MRSLFTTFLILLLLTLGCKDEEEIVPVPPPTPDAQTEPPPPDVPEEDDEPAEEVNSDVFGYGKFNNIPYRILLPRKYDSGSKYPLHIFLHGMGERGNDNEKQLDIGSKYYLADTIREKYPAIVVYPQCPSDKVWFDDDVAVALKELTDALQKEYGVDAKKISIGGFSMGAFGTFEVVARNPGLFEAAVAISGDGDEERVASMAGSRWQIFAAEKDDVIPIGRTKEIVEALIEAGATVSFTTYPDVTHDSTWAHALAEPGLFQWLFPKKADDGSSQSQSE